MYLVVDDSRSISMSPADLGPFFELRVTNKLRTDLIGCLSESCDGLVVHIFPESIRRTDHPVVHDTTNEILVNVAFKSILFVPVRGEVTDCIVTEVTRLGFFAYYGPLKVFVSSSCIPKELGYVQDRNCFASVAPSMNGHGHGGAKSMSIGADDEVRVRVLGVKKDQGTLFAVGTINGDFLGPIASQSFADSRHGGSRNREYGGNGEHSHGREDYAALPSSVKRSYASIAQ